MEMLPSVACRSSWVPGGHEGRQLYCSGLCVAALDQELLALHAAADPLPTAAAGVDSGFQARELESFWQRQPHQLRSHQAVDGVRLQWLVEAGWKGWILDLLLSFVACSSLRNKLRVAILQVTDLQLLILQLLLLLLDLAPELLQLHPLALQQPALAFELGVLALELSSLALELHLQPLGHKELQLQLLNLLQQSGYT